MRGRPLVILAAAALALGAGCDLTQKINLRSPFESSAAPSTPAAQVATVPGLRLVIHPSVFGTGALNDLLGDDTGVKDVTVREYAADRVVLDWSERVRSATATPRSGVITADGWRTAQAAVPPGLWGEGDVSVTGAGLLWLSPAAYAELAATNTAEWGVTSLGGDGLARIRQALDSFNKLAARLLPAASKVSPFWISKLNDVPAYPIRIDGRLVTVEAVRVASAVAEYVVLKDPGAPLVLKMTAQPAAYGAFSALKPLGLDPAAFGYEITEIRTK